MIGTITVERVDPPYHATEQEMLTAWLEYERATLAMKCDGLSPDQLVTLAVPPSTLTLLGLVRHMAEVERGWFRRTLAGEDVPHLYTTADDPEAEFDAARAGVEETFSAWEEECEESRQVVLRAASLEDFGRQRLGNTVSLRWILVHMIEEYARHNGHADLLRERLDGSVGE